MLILGLQKMTLLDFPGKIACTVFLGGCNFRCPFCHNASLAMPDGSGEAISVEDFLAFLDARRGRLQGVCISGGEPTLHHDLPELIREIKSRGFAVKLDTNGTNPQMLLSLINDGLLDYVAMDIKNSPEKYEATTSFSGIEKIRESVQFLLQCRVDYEFRTTVTGNLHTAEDFEKIGCWIAGAKRYFLQKFQDSGEILAKDGSSFEVSGEQLAEYQGIVKKFVPSVLLRGI